MITIDFTEGRHEAFKQLYEALPEKRQVTIIEHNRKPIRRRMERYDHNGREEVFIYGRGRSRYGFIVFPNSGRINDWEVIKVSEPRSNSKEQVWRKSWVRTLGMLEESGLWEDVANDIRIALAIGYDKLQKSEKLYWKRYPELSYEEQNEKRTQTIKEVDERLVEVSAENGKEYTDTSILWYMSNPAKIKPMYFGKYQTKRIRDEIAQAMQEKHDYEEYVGGNNYTGQGYDVTVHYNPELNKGWYSEEYRNCGNGHYYLMLDATHALFYEDD